MLRKLSSAAIFTPSGRPTGPMEPFTQARVLHFGVGKRRELTEQVLDGHLVHLVVAGDEQHPQRAVGSFAGKRLHAGVFGGTQRMQQAPRWCARPVSRASSSASAAYAMVMRRGLGGLGVGRITAGAA